MRKTILTIAILGSLTLAAALASPASSQEGTACHDCHQERYWQFDSGRAACFSTMPERCTDCHAGQEDTWDEEQAHGGLIASPNSETCEACHPMDALDRARRMGAAIGVRPQPKAAVLSPWVETAAPESPPVGSGRLTAGALFLGLGSSGVLLFGWRCWKQDCADRQS